MNIKERNAVECICGHEIGDHDGFGVCSHQPDGVFPVCGCAGLTLRETYQRALKLASPADGRLDKVIQILNAERNSAIESASMICFAEAGNLTGSERMASQQCGHKVAELKGIPR